MTSLMQVRAFRFVVSLLLVSIGLAVLNVGVAVADSDPKAIAPVAMQFDQCIDDGIKRIAPASVDLELLNRVSQHCYTKLFQQATLGDFHIRRAKFTQQSYDERILLWMVVLITISGVLMAGLQLLSSFRMAGKQSEQGELSIERGKIVLKSSVTGLFILLISFLFFSVFVFEIYKIKEIGEGSVQKDKDRTSQQRTEEPVQLETGQLVRNTDAKKGGGKKP